MPPTIKTETLHRAATFSRDALSAETRTATLAFSSEAPYERWFGTEVLDHSPASVDLSRFDANAMPLLLDHDPSSLVGTVERIEIGADRVGRAVVRFGKSARAEEAWQDVLDGIRKSVSVGYQINSMVEEKSEAGTVMRVNSWTPLEISMVSVPADFNVGVGRAADGEHETVIEREEAPAPEVIAEAVPEEITRQEEALPETEPAAVADIVVVSEQNRAAEDAVTGERDRVAGIKRVADLFRENLGGSYESAAREFIANGKTADEFAAHLSVLTSSRKDTTMELNQNERSQYSYARAISNALALVEGRQVSGLEAEISTDLARSMPSGQKTNGGIFVPLSLSRGALATSLYNTATKGAEGVFTEPGDFIELLRNQSVAVQLGARVLTGLQGPVSFPRQATANTAYWMAENSGADVTLSNATLGSMALTPKTLQASTAYSRQLLAQAVFDVEMLIRQDLAAVHALAWDAAVLHGAGNANDPTGIYAAANVNTVAMGGVPTFGKLIDMVAEVMKDNALNGSLAFVTCPGMAAKLAQTVVAASTDTRMIWDGALGNGTLAGYKALASNQVSAVLGAGAEQGIVFGNWNDVVIGQWGALEIVVDPYALKKQGMVEVTSFQMCDIGLRHPQSFCKATGATLS
jgi:HK97 family phage major capsid protein